MPAIPTSITRLIQGSGNTFHAKVARWLQGGGWHTVVSPYYMDQTQSKARELDLIAEKVWPIRNSLGQYEGDVVVRLFIECKFVASDAVFWFAPKDMASARELVRGFGPFAANNQYSQTHHYLTGSLRVAKLFASSNEKTQENEPFYKALNQALNATVAMRRKPPSHPKMSGRRHNKLLVLDHCCPRQPCRGGCRVI